MTMTNAQKMRLIWKVAEESRTLNAPFNDTAVNNALADLAFIACDLDGHPGMPKARRRWSGRLWSCRRCKRAYRVHTFDDQDGVFNTHWEETDVA